MNRILIAGIGNVLRGDDGFGPAVIDALQRRGVDAGGVRLAEVGIGGVALVHELFDGFDTLIIVDCVERGAAPGSLFLLEVHVPPIDAIPATQRLTMSTDMHRAGPDRALLVARAAGVLPSRVWLVGCQPGETEEFSTDLSPAVRDALPAAVNAIRGLIGSLSSSVSHHAGR